MIKAEIIKDSIGPNNSRITTFLLTYPRMIHSEFMTHRVFSRNASSSRAIPVKKQIEAVLENPVIPIAFTKNKAGMQGGDPLDEIQTKLAIEVWNHALFHAVDKAKMLSDLGLHKQYANRILEPFSHITVVCTATDYANFFALRTHKDAQPEFQAVATLMWEKYSQNEPTKLEFGDWHLPFITDEEISKVKALLLFRDYQDEYMKELDLLIKRSVARCARTSYNTHDGTENSIEKDLELYNRLVGGDLIHASPTEHQAMALKTLNYSGNFKGWLQYRKTLKNENILKFPI